MTWVRPERTAWRDEGISRRHREWGFDCPATDIDFLLIEYTRGRAVALIEYKQDGARVQHSSHPTYRAMIDLGNRANLPVFAVRYAANFKWFRVTALNKVALDKQATRAKWLLEPSYVEMLYGLRGIPIPPEVLMKLDREADYLSTETNL